MQSRGWSRRARPTPRLPRGNRSEGGLDLRHHPVRPIPLELAAVQRSARDGRCRGPGPTGGLGRLDGRNILWKVEVPRPGFGSPIVWNDKVFLSGPTSPRARFLLERGGRHPPLAHTDPARRRLARRLRAKVTEDTGYAASTMATNGSAVFAVFATGDVASLDLDGNILWVRSLGAPTHIYGYASSPACVADLLIVQFDQEENGRLIAYEAATGKIRWESPRRVQPSWASLSSSMQPRDRRSW